MPGWTRYWGNGQIKSEGRWAGYQPCGSFKCFNKKGNPTPCAENLLFMHAGCKQTREGADCPQQCAGDGRQAKDQSSIPTQ